MNFVLKYQFRVPIWACDSKSWRILNFVSDKFFFHDSHWSSRSVAEISRCAAFSKFRTFLLLGLIRRSSFCLRTSTHKSRVLSIRVGSRYVGCHRNGTAGEFVWKSQMTNYSSVSHPETQIYLHSHVYNVLGYFEDLFSPFFLFCWERKQAIFIHCLLLS